MCPANASLFGFAIDGSQLAIGDGQLAMNLDVGCWMFSVGCSLFKVYLLWIVVTTLGSVFPVIWSGTFMIT